MNKDLSRKEKLIKRFRYLWTWELFNGCFLLAVVFFCDHILQQPVRYFAYYSVAIVTLLFWQGAAYWFLKLRAVRGGSAISCSYLQWFARLKWMNLILFMMLPLVLCFEVWESGHFPTGFNLRAGCALYALAVLEKINYYHYQLMYDTRSDWRYLMKNRKLKKSILRRELENL